MAKPDKLLSAGNRAVESFNRLSALYDQMGAEMDTYRVAMLDVARALNDNQPPPPNTLVFYSDFSEHQPGQEFPDGWTNTYKRYWPTNPGGNGFEARYEQDARYSGGWGLYTAIPGGVRAAHRVVIKGLADTPRLPDHAIYRASYWFSHVIDTRGTYLNAFQWKRQFQKGSSGYSEPCGSVNIVGNGTSMHFVYNHKMNEAGGEDKRDLPLLRVVDLPLNERVELEVEWKWATDNTGLIRGRVNGVLIFEYTDIRTELDIYKWGGTAEEKNGNLRVWGPGNYSDKARVAFVIDDMAVYKVE